MIMDMEEIIRLANEKIEDIKRCLEDSGMPEEEINAELLPYIKDVENAKSLKERYSWVGNKSKFLLPKYDCIRKELRKAVQPNSYFKLDEGRIYCNNEYDVEDCLVALFENLMKKE